MSVFITVAMVSTIMSEPLASPLKFVDATDVAQLEFTHTTPPDHQSGPMVAGGAVGDFNNDGYPDLFVIGGGGRSDALFINNGDGTFTDKANEWGIADPHRGVGATVADYDDDGDEDIFVTSFGNTDVIANSGYHRLYQNQGDHFLNVAAAAGVATTTTTHPDGYGSAFGDYDLDGDLDLFVGAWHNSAVLGSRLFQNQGDGTFINVTESAQVFDASTRAFGAIWADMDGDRFPELLVAGDFGSNRYYKNLTNGRFVELDPGSGLEIDPESSPWTIGKAHNAMGTTIGDFNHDGRLDWFVTAIWPTANFDNDFWGNGLYLNHGNHTFTEVASTAGVNDGGWGWGTAAADFDNDGHTDLIMTNGWPFDDPVTGASFTDERSYLWRNRGDLTFADEGEEAGLNHTGQGRALMTFDYDRDGDLDVVILSNAEPLQLFRNDLILGTQTPSAHNWLQIRLDTRNNNSLAPHGLGAKISYSANGIKRVHHVTSGGSYLGQSQIIAHLGLASATQVDRIAIEWSNGQRVRIKSVAANQQITIHSQNIISPSPYMGRFRSN